MRVQDNANRNHCGKSSGLELRDNITYIRILSWGSEDAHIMSIGFYEISECTNGSCVHMCFSHLHSADVT